MPWQALLALYADYESITYILLADKCLGCRWSLANVCNTCLPWRWVTYDKHTHTHPFNGPFSSTTRVSRYQKGETNLDCTVARDSEWQWHQLGHMQVCTSLQTDNNASNPPLSFLQARCPSCHPTNDVKALKGFAYDKALYKSTVTNAVWQAWFLVCLSRRLEQPAIASSLY